MSIVTKPISIVKGIPANITLNPVELEEHTAITDGFYSSQSNWEKVVIFYRSSIGNQKKTLVFDVENENFTGIFRSSVRARSIFYAQTIFLHDYDGAYFAIKRESLTVGERADLDILLT